MSFGHVVSLSKSLSISVTYEKHTQHYGLILKLVKVSYISKHKLYSGRQQISAGANQSIIFKMAQIIQTVPSHIVLWIYYFFRSK